MPPVAVETFTLGDHSFSRVYLESDGTFPNNPRFPVVVYRDVFCEARDGDGAELLVRNGWTRPWAWGVFTYHHYHSTAWEALLCVRGSADVQFGGPSGPVLQPAKGDLVLVPPGVAHKQLADRDGFTLLGAYPSHDGCRTPSADTVRGAPTAAQARNIAACATPVLDPRWGGSTPWEGGLVRLLGDCEECRA